jgi:hypothetical protein
MANGWWGNWRTSLPAHTGNLQPTDLIECTSIIGGVEINTAITGTQIIAGASGGSSPYTTIGNSVGLVIGTGNVVNTISASVLIPANTLVAGDVLQIRGQVRKLLGSGTTNTKIYINTINSLTGAIQIGQAGNMTGSGQMQRVFRDFYVNSASLLCYLPTNPLSSDITTGAVSTIVYAPSANAYIIFALQNLTISEQCQVMRLNLMKY